MATARSRRTTPTRRAMAPDDLYHLHFVSDARISPDGEQVAYTVTWVDEEDRSKYRSRLMLVGADGGSPRALTEGRARDTAPRWSPDGRSLGFLSTRDGEKPQLFVLPLDGGEPRQLTRLKHGAGAPTWSPDGTRLAFATDVDIRRIAEQEGQSDEKGKAPRLRLVTRVRHKADGAGLREARHAHLFVVPADGSAEPRQVTDGDWDDAEPAWSPDATLLAFAANRERDRDLSTLRDVWVTPASGGRARRVTRHRGEASAPAWSPNGQSIAYLGHERGRDYGSVSELMVVPARGGAPRSLSAEMGWNVANAALSDGRDPLSASPPHWLPDGTSLLALVSDHGRVPLVRFSTEGAAPTPVLAGNREVASFSAAASGGRLAFAASDPTHPYEVFVADADGENERQASHENAAFLRQVEVVEPKPVSFESTDGETVEGWLIEPRGRAGRGKRPLVLEIHGGPEAMYAWTFMHEFQVLAARGYGVLYTNPRGSQGYGERFAGRIFADWGSQDAADCLAAVDWAVRTLPWVGRDRLHVTGGSYGGYMTAWLVGHDQRFRAAVATRGLYNWASFYGTADIGPTFGDYVLGGPVYEREDLYHRMSPITYAPEMRTPLLLIQNEGDLRCPMEQAEQLYVVLKRLGRVETELVRFPEESHNLSRSGRPDRRVERLERIVGWFDRHGGSGG